MIDARARTVLLIGAVVMLGGVALLSQTQIWRTIVEPGSQPIPPHTVTLREYVYLTGQKPLLSREIVRAVKGDGTTAEVYTNYTATTGAYKWTQRVLLGVGGVYAEASPDLSLLSSLKQEKLDYKRLTLFGDASKSCTESLAKLRIGDYVARETILGYEALKIKTHDDPSSVGYQWRSPQLGCAIVRQEMRFRNADGSIRHGNVMEPVMITAGEPRSELFSFSPQFNLVSPLEYQRQLHRHVAGKDVADSELPPVLFQLDQLYKGNSHRPPAKFDPRG